MLLLNTQYCLALAGYSILFSSRGTKHFFARVNRCMLFTLHSLLSFSLCYFFESQCELECESRGTKHFFARVNRCMLFTLAQNCFVELEGFTSTPYVAQHKLLTHFLPKKNSP